MFKKNQLVEVIGVLRVTEVTEEYTIFDPFEKGDFFTNEKYGEKGYISVDSNGTEAFNGMFRVGDFVKFDGTYEVLRSNEIYTKIKFDSKLLSIPNSKIQEVE